MAAIVENRRIQQQRIYVGGQTLFSRSEDCLLALRSMTTLFKH